jgi:Spy/CpxP family protein refolding chaperone
MKLKSLFALAALLLLASAAFAQGSADAPKLVIKSKEHNLGEVKKGTQAQHTFVFKNEGKADLLIKNVAPS